MKPETAKRLHDAYAAATELQQFIDGYTAASFDRDRGLQLIVHWGAANDRLPALVDELGRLLRDAPPPERG